MASKTGRPRAGTAILVSPQVQQLVISEGIIIPGRAQFLKLHWNDDSTLAIINVYAPTESCDRKRLWDNIIDANIEADLFILAGDLNMVEQAAN